jgi:putative restriction endonuclease
VATLSELTDRAAVERALAEFRELGRERFLQRHNLERSRDYFVWVDGEPVDSKPILAVAFGYQHPQHGLLSVRDFSGGTGGAVQALRRLGFDAATRAQLHPPTGNGPSSSSALKCRVEVLELDPCILGREAPVDPTTGSVAR